MNVGRNHRLRIRMGMLAKKITYLTMDTWCSGCPYIVDLHNMHYPGRTVASMHAHTHAVSLIILSHPLTHYLSPSSSISPLSPLSLPSLSPDESLSLSSLSPVSLPHISPLSLPLSLSLSSLSLCRLSLSLSRLSLLPLPLSLPPLSLYPLLSIQVSHCLSITTCLPTWLSCLISLIPVRLSAAEQPFETNMNIKAKTNGLCEYILLSGQRLAVIIMSR